jgi:inosose dehydratase
MAASAAAGAAWLAVSPAVGAEKVASLGAEKEASVKEYGGFRVGIQSNVLNAFSPELEPMLGHIAGLGLRWIEFANWHYPVTDDPDQIASVRALLDAHDIGTEAYFLGEIEADADKLRQTFAFAQKNGVSVLVGQPTPEAFPILDGLVKEFEIRVGVHNYGPGHRFDRIEDLLVAVAPWDWRIGYCLDTAHAMRSGEDPVAAVRRLGSRLHGLHLREQAAVQRDPQPPETVVGEGGMDLEALCRALRDVGFSGPLSIEIYFNPEAPLEPLQKSLANFAAAARATA